MLFFLFIGTIKKCLEKNAQYDLILTAAESILLGSVVELLEIFNVFTIYVQGNQYPTMNSLLLLYSEMKDRLETISLMSAVDVIQKAADILLENFETRFPLTLEIIAASILDPSVQYIKFVNDWLRENSKIISNFILCFIPFRFNYLFL